MRPRKINVTKIKSPKIKSPKAGGMKAKVMKAPRPRKAPKLKWGAAFMLLFMLAAVPATALTTCNGSPTKLKGCIATSPFWQADNNGMYTFIAISHPSIPGVNGQIGLTLTATGSTTALGVSNGSVTFTVNAGTTAKVFIANSNNTSLLNSPVYTQGTSYLIVTTTAGTQTGEVTIVNSNQYPLTYQANNTYGGGNQTLTGLSMWGMVVNQNTGAGFAMEFIGDMRDSNNAF